MTTELTTYLIIHGVVTIGAIFGFFLRIEHRLTKVETKMELLEKKI
jgi:uncharacterized membrane protein YqgA involved in biofilm formation